MDTIPPLEMLAVLLNMVGKEATESTLKGIPKNASTQVSEALEEFKVNPPTQQEVEYVIDDFLKYFRFALKTVDPAKLNPAASDIDTAIEEEKEEEEVDPAFAEEEFEVEIEPVKKFATPNLTGDHNQDLNRLHPYQVAYALRNEDAITISLVLKNLATEHAAKTLEFLPEAKQPAVFLQLAKPNRVKHPVLSKLMEASIELAMRVEKREPIDDATTQMVTLIRSVPKAMRAPMMDELAATDEELCKSVKSQLYRFEDLNVLDDRDLQKVLSETSTDSLVVALQGAEQSMIDRIFNNMSKRARESLQEEMSFKTNAKQDEIDMGREAIAQILARLDESGAISLE